MIFGFEEGCDDWLEKIGYSEEVKLEVTVKRVVECLDPSLGVGGKEALPSFVGVNVGM